MNRHASRQMLATLALLMVTLGIQGAPSHRFGPALLTCEMRFLQVPRSEVTRLLPKVGEPVAPETLRQLQQWIVLNHAKILAQPAVSTLSGETVQCRANHNLESPMGSHRIREFGVLLNATPLLDPDGVTIHVKANASVTWPRAADTRAVPSKANDDNPGWTVTADVRLADGTTTLVALLNPVSSPNDVVLVLLTAGATQLAEAPAQNLPSKHAAPAAENVTQLDAYTKFERRLAAIILPEVKLRETPLEDALHVLTTLSIQADPEQVGVQVLVADSRSSAKSRLVTLTLRHTPLSDMVKYIAALGGLKPVLRPESNAVMLVSLDYVGPLIERMYPLPPWILSNIELRKAKSSEELGAVIKRLLEDINGGLLPPGSALVYEPTTKQIRVTTSIESHRTLARLLSRQR